MGLWAFSSYSRGVKSRRDFLTAVAQLSAVGLPGCILPDRRGPEVLHSVTPMGPMPAARGAPGRLWAGAATVDITPPDGAPVWLAGYGFQRRMQRVNDRISARAIYLDDGTHRVAVVVADVVGLLANTTHRVRRLLGPGTQTVVASTHNHQSPDTMGYWGKAILHAVPAQSGIDVAYQRVFERRLAQAVGRAAWSAQPAELSVCEAPLWSGAVKNLREPEDVPDKMLVAELRTRHARKTICTIVNFACHPETLGPRAQLLSADFPGPMRAEVERVRGGTCMFINGALGGMLTPQIDDEAELPERLDFVQLMGQRLGKDACVAIEGVKARPVEAVGYVGRPVELGQDNPLYGFLERTGLVETRPHGPQGGLMTEVGRLDLGPLALGVMPGEPTPAVGRMVQDKLRPAEFAGVIGLGNDELGYLLTKAQFDDPDFAYEVSVSPGRGSVDLLMAALDDISSKRGRRCRDEVPSSRCR